MDFASVLVHGQLTSLSWGLWQSITSSIRSVMEQNTCQGKELTSESREAKTEIGNAQGPRTCFKSMLPVI